MRIRRPIGRRPIDGRPVFDPRTINPVRPGMQQPGMQPDLQQKFPFGVGINPDGTLQNMHPAAGGIRPGVQQPFTPQAGAITNPIRQPGGMGPLPNSLGPTAPVGDPRLGAATIPGNQLQMQMRGPTQAAPVQPVPAMKKGGVVRGGRAEIKGLRPAKIT